MCLTLIPCSPIALAHVTPSVTKTSAVRRLGLMSTDKHPIRIYTETFDQKGFGIFAEFNKPHGFTELIY